MFQIENELQKLPDLPGVYIMHDKSDRIIYVGKALSLRKRVHQYFQASHNEGIRKKQMVSHIERFEYIVTDSEMEALILECNLIKEHRPKYNTMLRDDKTYPYIKVTTKEKYPRVLFSRRVQKDGSRYFGPFTSAGAVKDTIDLVQKICRLRTCNLKFPKDFGKSRPCLNYHMEQCRGVCEGIVSEEEYGKQVDRAIDFLSGNYKPIADMLEEKMLEASKLMEFEKAANYRDLLESVKVCIQRQKVTTSGQEDRDIVAIAVSGEDAVAQVFFIRDGKMIGRDHFFINVRMEDKKKDLLQAFLQQFYSGTPFIPREIFIQEDIDDHKLMEDWLSDKKGQRVYLVTPKIGQKEKLVELAKKNAQLVLSQDKERIKKEEGRTIGAMKEVAKCIGIENANRMEAYDISNTSGFASVGSMVVFEKGAPLRSDYRKFKIKTVSGPDDYASMQEVLERRFTHGVNDKNNQIESSFNRFPDLILMDGGKGQVGIAKKVLDKMGIDIPVCGMVKDDHHRTRGLYYEGKEIPIDKGSEAFKLITRIQDEAHRFAIEYHRSLRSKGQVKSFLDDISGIGPTRRKALMRTYSGIEEMKNASEKELAAVVSMNKEAAKALYEYLHKEEG